MKTSITCPKCKNITNIHAQGFCHTCYKRLRREGFIGKLHNAPNELSLLQKEVLIGSLLGDGCLRKIGKTERANANFSISRSINDKDYLNWEFNLFKN